MKRGRDGVQRYNGTTHGAGSRDRFGPQPHRRPGPSIGIARGRYALITGGAGFIGTNVAATLARGGRPVVIYDNLARPGVEANVSWLRSTFGDLVRIERADVADRTALRRAVAGAECVFHFAAQVAVTTSLNDPLADFESNARGTLNVLEACRLRDVPPPLLFTSTNKVYGGLEDVGVMMDGPCYAPCDESLRAWGIAEDRPLDLHSPYGCS
jgi:CDP-paratose 2-epimerase